MRHLQILAIAFAMTVPAVAQDVADNEPLVMRLVFEDCLGYVRDGTEPFKGLTKLPLRPEVEANLAEASLRLANRIHLLSLRYYALWGEDGTNRLCVVMATDDYKSYPRLLAVQPTGFLDRMTKRAATEGLTDASRPEIFDMRGTPIWSEPGDEPDEIRVVTIPIEESVSGSPIDVGAIVVAVGIDRPTS